MKNLREMNIARGIGIFLVIIGHSFPTEDFNNNGIWKFVHHFIYSFHMPLFFFVSGFFAIKIYNICNLKQYEVFANNKFKRLIIPYLSITMLATPIKLFMNKFAQRPTTFSDIIVNTFIYPWDNPIIFFWFIYTLFIMFLIAPIIIKIDKKYIILMFIVLSVLPFKYTTLLNINGLIHYSIYFYLGLFTREHYVNLINLKNKNLLMMFGLIILVYLNFINIDSDILSNIILILTSILGTICTILIANSIKDKNIGNLFNFLGNYSYDIFLFSWFFQTASRVVFYQILKFNYNISILIIVFSGVMPILLSKFLLNNLDILSKLFLGRFSNKIEIEGNTVTQ